MGSTTILIRRRIRHWKTTAAGVATLLGPIALSLWPEHSTAITNAVFAITGAGLISAADSDKPPRIPGIEVR